MRKLRIILLSSPSLYIYGVTFEEQLGCEFVACYLDIEELPLAGSFIHSSLCSQAGEPYKAFLLWDHHGFCWIISLAGGVSSAICLLLLLWMNAMMNFIIALILIYIKPTQRNQYIMNWNKLPCISQCSPVMANNSSFLFILQIQKSSSHSNLCKPPKMFITLPCLQFFSQDLLRE